MKEEYTELEAEVVIFDNGDIITESVWVGKDETGEITDENEWA